MDKSKNFMYFKGKFLYDPASYGIGRVGIVSDNYLIIVNVITGNKYRCWLDKNTGRIDKAKFIKIE